MGQAFNNLAFQDNRFIKSIAFFCMIFLPPIFISVCVQASLSTKYIALLIKK